VETVVAGPGLDAEAEVSLALKDGSNGSGVGGGKVTRTVQMGQPQMPWYVHVMAFGEKEKVERVSREIMSDAMLGRRRRSSVDSWGRAAVIRGVRRVRAVKRVVRKMVESLGIIVAVGLVSV
jgi:hypothetical protein